MNSNDLIVTLPQGKLQGSKNVTNSGFGFLSFQGIPYAKPPIGNLRFVAPQPPDRWTGVSDATVPGKASCQVNMFSNIYQGEEDCLYLNIFTPNLPTAGKKKKPVIFSIHGGGFINGSGSPDLYGPDYLVEQDIILVTFNYRVGVLGFLSLRNEDVPGNAGLKDQIAALRWVHGNISAFGGDPGNVTIYGQSAGATSVHYMLLNEKIQGVFHKAIASSGCVFSTWALQPSPIENALQLCKVLGQPQNDVCDALKFLRTVSPKRLVMAHEEMMNPEKIGNFSCIFSPVIENIFPHEEAVITEKSVVKIKEGRFNQVPFLCGTNTAEGMLSLRKTKIDAKLCKKIDSNFEQYLDVTGTDMENLLEKSKEIREFYFGTLPVCVPTIGRLINLKGDTVTAYGVYKSADLHSRISKCPVYYYKFSFDKKGFFKLLMDLNFQGTCHGDDLGYLFKVKGIDLIDPLSIKTKQRMVKMWTDFAKTGNPTLSRSELIPIIWKPVNPEDWDYLDINSSLTLHQNPDQRRMEFLNDIYNI